MAQPTAPDLIAGHGQDVAVSTGGALDGGHPAIRQAAQQSAAAIPRSAALPPRSLWPRLPGSAAAVLAGVLLFDAEISRGAGLVVLYIILPIAVAAIELAGAVPARARAVGLEFALGAWILVLVLIVAAFIRFGVTHGIAAVAITVVVADLASFFLAVRRRLPYA
jgi:hypothetical protein